MWVPLQRARVEPVAQELVLRSPTHFDRVLNRGTRAMKPWVFWCARDGDHLQVQLGSQTAIEAEFFLAEEVPFGKRREIDKAQIDRLLIL